MLRCHILPPLGDVPVTALTRPQLRAWNDTLQDEGGALVAAKSYRLVRAMLVTAVEGPPTSRAGRRVVTIPAAIVPDVTSHLEHHTEPGPDGRVFVGQLGGHLRSSSFMVTEFRPPVARLGLKGIRFHDPRHTGNTLAASTGASLANLMARRGHASSEAALRYQHASRAQDVVLAAALSDLVDRARQESERPGR